MDRKSYGRSSIKNNVTEKFDKIKDWFQRQF